MFYLIQHNDFLPPAMLFNRLLWSPTKSDPAWDWCKPASSASCIASWPIPLDTEATWWDDPDGIDNAEA